MSCSCTFTVYVNRHSGIHVPAYLVEVHEVSNGRGLLCVVRELVLQISDEHPKLCTPISKVVQSKKINSCAFIIR